jgi:hypothetical protein
MDPASICCPNWAGPARGHTGQGTIAIHSRQDQRCLCPECHQTCRATQGTALYRLRTAAETVTLVVTVRAHGCPPQAIGAAVGFDERTVRRGRGGRPGPAVQESLVEPPRDLGQVPAEERGVKQQGGRVWMAWAMLVAPRLGLAGEGSAQRAMTRLRRLMARVRHCALPRPRLRCPDGCITAGRAIRATCRAPERPGAPGRPRLRPWRNVCSAQVVKRYAQRRGGGVERRLLDGTRARVETLRRRSQGGGVLNTALRAAHRPLACAHAWQP